MKKILASRSFRQGSVATATTVIVIALIVVLNMVVTSLSAKYNLSLDLTTNKIFGISEDTKTFLANLDKDVNVYVLNTEQGFTGGGEYFVQANEVIQKYAQESSRVTVQYVDLVRDPTFAQKFPKLNLNTSSIVVASGEKSTDLTPYDLYNVQTDPYYGSTQITSSKAEQAMTSAMLKVTSEEIVKVVMLGGHDETPPEGLRALLDTNSYEVIDQNLLTEAIDPAAKIAVLNAPMRDLTTDEVAKLDSFLYNDGKLGKNLVYFAGDTQPEMPILSAFLADWGIGVGENTVFESSLNRVMNMNAFLPSVDYAEEEYAKTVRERSLLTVIPYARPLTALYEAKSNKVLSTILNFSESSGIVPANADNNWQPSKSDISGPIPALIITQDRTYEGTTLLASNVAVCGSALAVEQSFLQATSLGNGEFFLSMFNKLADRKDTISIQSKTIGGNELGVQSQQVVVIGLLLAIVLPLAVLVCGTVVWLKRRHK